MEGPRERERGGAAGYPETMRPSSTAGRDAGCVSLERQPETPATSARQNRIKDRRPTVIAGTPPQGNFSSPARIIDAVVGLSLSSRSRGENAVDRRRRRDFPSHAPNVPSDRDLSKTLKTPVNESLRLARDARGLPSEQPSRIAQIDRLSRAVRSIEIALQYCLCSQHVAAVLTLLLRQFRQLQNLVRAL